MKANRHDDAGPAREELDEPGQAPGGSGAHRHDDAGPAREERDQPGEVPPEASEEAVPAEELPEDAAAAADADQAPVPDPKASARVPRDV